MQNDHVAELSYTHTLERWTTSTKSEQTQQCGGSIASRLLYAVTAEMSAGMNCSKPATELNRWLTEVLPTIVTIYIDYYAEQQIS